MQGYCPLASSSRGNCVYFATKNTKILIDCGISGKALQSKLAELNVSIEEIDAVLVTHEHTDHIQGLKTITWKRNIPIIANKETANGITEHFQHPLKFKIFATGETFSLKDLTIHPFSIHHDTLDPVAFTIQTQAIKAGFCTDLGFASSLVQHHLENCTHLYIEANHEPSMVHASPRPPFYKQRVLGRCGHLSNEACAHLLKNIIHPNLKHICLAHLSQECNTPEKAKEVLYKTLGDVQQSFDFDIAHCKERSNFVCF